MKRIEAYLSSLGYCSRSEARKFMKQNEVFILDKRVFNPSIKAEHKDIFVNGEKLEAKSLQF